jgi:hypothetical protein
MEFWPSVILRERCSLAPVWHTHLRCASKCPCKSPYLTGVSAATSWISEQSLPVVRSTSHRPAPETAPRSRRTHLRTRKEPFRGNRALGTWNRCIGITGQCTVIGSVVMSTQREKMLAGEMYDPVDPELVAARARARDLCQQLNTTRESEQAERRRILGDLFGKGGDNM